MRHERRRLDAFDVPRMKVFVTDEAEQIAIAFGHARIAKGWQVASRRDERRARAMLQPAVAVIHHV